MFCLPYYFKNNRSAHSCIRTSHDVAALPLMRRRSERRDTHLVFAPLQSQRRQQECIAYRSTAERSTAERGGPLVSSLQIHSSPLRDTHLFSQLHSAHLHLETQPKTAVIFTICVKTDNTVISCPLKYFNYHREMRARCFTQLVTFNSKIAFHRLIVELATGSPAHSTNK